MAGNMKLFINDKLVEFSTDPKVLYTYQASDTNNPTVVKNCFTKTVEIEGTPNNNELFGHYWDVEKYITSVGYNSSKKAPFQLFVGNDLYEEGYMKLDSISTKNGNLKYNVTLYGGLGDFFYQLSTAENGDKKKLSDLVYTEGGDVTEFDFTINIDNVKQAWGVLDGTVNPNFEQNKKWKHINFIPAYNGIPSDFDADKVVINTYGTSLRNGASDNEGNWYYTKNKWTIGTLPQEMTEWEIRDLRSYLQRPCIKMSSIVNACCNPDCNGGYTVNLDPDFFSSSNPYWDKTYLTLPQIQSLDYTNSQQVLTGATLMFEQTTGSTTGLMYQDMHFDLGQFSESIKDITIRTKIYNSNGWSKTSYVWFWNYNGDSYHSGWWCVGSLFCQLIALNGDTVVGASNVYNLTTPIRHNGKLYYGYNGYYPESTGIDPDTGLRQMGNGSQYVPYMDMPITNVLGTFSSSGFKREDENSAHTFTFTISNINATVTGLKMVFYWGASADKVKHYTTTTMFSATYYDSWTQNTVASQGGGSAEDTYMISSETTHNLTAVVGESLGRTGTKVTKQLLLNTESTPCDYLLSYCKMFGLHFTKDIGSKTINILTRKSFYNRTNVVDLEDYIDHGKDVNITPLMFSTKWYEFRQEMDETEYQQKYLTANGVEYGCKVLDTGYEFNVEKKNLLDKNCIKSGIEVLEKSKWFAAYNNDDSMRPWMKLGLKYTLWRGDDETEINAGVGNNGDLFPLNEGQGLKYYDVYPKLQFHSDDNSPTDGNDCLVFFSGFKGVVSGRTNPLTYILSDDSNYQNTFNDGTPCWLFTKQETVDGKRLCYKLTSLPVFERYLTSADSGNIIKSLDFGSAQELYIPNYNLTDDTNIYHNFWRSYTTDLFDLNTKQMTCYVKIDTNPGTEWLRRFYWFNNAIWVINKITDWNPASEDTTKVDFIKVQDISNYTSITQAPSKVIGLSASTYNVAFTGGTVTLTVDVDAGVPWKLASYGPSVATLSATGGTGPGTVTATLGENTEESVTFTYFRATRTDNSYWALIKVNQGYYGEQSVVASPEDVVIPGSGGSVTINFTWFNQGDTYIDEVDYNEGSSYLQFTADTDTYKYENKAVLYFDPNTGDTVLHNYCTFKDQGHNVSCSIGIDQIPTGYTFSHSGDTVTIPVEYATGATFSNVPNWITVVNNLDHTYSLVAVENPYQYDRTDVVTMSISETSADFSVFQDAASYFNVSRQDGAGNVLVTGGQIELMVVSTTAWTGTSNVNWATLGVSSSTTGESFYVSFGENTGETRMATFTFVNSSGETITYTQVQDGFSIDNFVEPTALTYPGSGGTGTFSINTDSDMWVIHANTDWVTVSSTGGTGSTTITVTAATNTGYERNGSITVYNVTRTKTYVVTVIQDTGNVFAVTRINGSGDVAPTGGTITLRVDSPNKAWTATTTDNFITLQTTAATASTTFNVDFTGNTGSTRIASINFVDALGQTITYTQSQAGTGTINLVTPTLLEYDATGGTQVITVNIPNIWGIVANPGWVTCLPSTGSTPGTVSATTAPYSGSEDRYGTIVFYDNTTTNTYLVTVVQHPASGEILAVNPSNIYFEASGGTAQFVIISNTDWTIG